MICEELAPEEGAPAGPKTRRAPAKPRKVALKVRLEFPQLRSLLLALKKLEYVVGVFNSFSGALMKMLDESLFGAAVFLKGAAPETAQVCGSFVDRAALSALENARAEYFDFLREKQTRIAQRVFRPLNEKLRLMEEYLFEHVPGLRLVWQNHRSEQAFAAGAKSKAPAKQSPAPGGLLPRLELYEARPRSLKNAFKSLPKGAVALRFDYCSEALFVNVGRRSVFMFDLFQKKVVLHLRDFPFALGECITRRNLRFYTEKSKLQVKFHSFNQVEVEDSLDADPGAVTEKSLGLFAAQKKVIRDYFRHFSEEVWFHRKEAEDDYALVLTFRDSDLLCVFLLKDKSAKQDFEKKRARAFLQGTPLSKLLAHAEALEKQTAGGKTQ